MQIHEIKSYSFAELATEIKEKVISKQQENFLDYDWWHFTLESYKEELENSGFSDIEINFTGFWSQGDGASFTAKLTDVKAFIKKHKIYNQFRILYCNSDYVEAYIYRKTSHYCHENTVAVAVDKEHYNWCLNDKIIVKIIDKLYQFEEYLSDFVIAKSQEIYRNLEDEYNILISDESIIDNITANDYCFSQKGEIINHLIN